MRRITARLLERSLASGARSAEAYAKIGETLGVGLDAASGLQATHTAEGGIGLRVFRDNGAEGFACACGARAGGTDEARLVEAAIAAARSPREPFPLARGKVRDERGLGIFDPRLETATQADLEELLEETTAETMRIDPRVRRLDTAFLAASTSRVRIDNTEGFTGSYKQTLFHLRMGVDARDADRSILVGQSQTARRLTAFSPTLFADRTARLAITTLEGRPPATGRFPALLAPRAAIELLRLFAGTLPPAGLAAGRRVAAPAVSIIDDGRLPGGVASAPFDGEGVPTQRTRVVSQGLPGRMIHDLSSAAASRAAPTGNGVRRSFREPPRRGTTNLFIAPGSDEPEDLLAGMGQGVWIQTLRPTTAVRDDRSAVDAVATGRWVNGGHPQFAVAGVVVRASLSDLLDGIIGIGNDLNFYFPAGSFGSPSLLIREIAIAPAWS